MSQKRSEEDILLFTRTLIRDQPEDLNCVLLDRQ